MVSFSSIKNYHAFLAENSDGCQIAVKHYLAEIKANWHLNAFIEVFAEDALQKAAGLDELRKKNKTLKKLHGVIIGIKDVISYKGHRVSAASKMLEDFMAVYNATAVEKLLEEDAIIIGRQNCDEFAMGSSSENSAFGCVLNAADNSRVSGGSSGGSAVAVQAGLCMVSLGSDTGGSVRQPADFCGIVGFKPTYGRISRYGLIAYASSFDQIGILANTVDDTALILEVISGADEFDSTVSHDIVPEYASLLDAEKNKSYNFAYFEETLENPSLDKEILTQFKWCLKKLTDSGHKVTPVKFPLSYIIPAYYVLTTAEASSNLARYDGIKYGRGSDENLNLHSFYKQVRSNYFGKEVKRRIMLGTFILSAGYYDAYYMKALKIRRLLVEKTQKLFEEYDAILSPTVPSVAFKIGEKKDPVEMFLADIYTVYANLTGIPAISIPAFKHSSGLPFGLQILAFQKKDLPLLRISKKLMQLISED